MNTGMLIRELKVVVEKHKNDYVPTFQTNIAAMCGDVIPKLERLREYEKIGTVEEIKKVVRFLSLDNDNGIVEDIEELNKYKLIGTVEECREAVEKRRAKKPKGRYKTRYVWDAAYCPECDCGITARWNFCQNCGKAIDWSDNPVRKKNMEGIDMSMISEQVKKLRGFAEGYAKCGNWHVADTFREAADTIEGLSAKLEAENREKLTAYHDEKSIKVNDDIRRELVEQYNKAFKLLIEMPLKGNEVWHGYVLDVMQTLGFLIDNIDFSDSHNPDRS